jgi:H/ACA ribonucleoprotein complex subunit 3
VKSGQRLFIGGKPLTYDPDASLGIGGEGEVFDLRDGRALKLLFRPDNPQYAGSDPQQERDREAAKRRIALAQQKLPVYPKLDPRVIAPLDVVRDDADLIVGFTMQSITMAQVLRQYSKPNFRQQSGIDHDAIVRLYLEMHGLVTGLHAKQVQIGDFNHLGVLVKQATPYLIDADSFQFGKFKCRSFTPRFVDPLVCLPNELLLNSGHSELTDWYAFALMLFECLTYVAPYGGVLTGPKAKSVHPDDRPLARLSVFDSAVRYPDKGIPLTNLSDDLLEFYRKLLQEDWRGVFPIRLLERMRWVKCSACGAVHCRPKCPVCAVAVPGAHAPDMVERRGRVTVTRLFNTPGVILDANLSPGGKVDVVWHEDGAFYRENRVEVLRGDLEPGLVTRVCGPTTLFGSGNTLLAVTPGQQPQSMSVDTYRSTLPVFDATTGGYVWVAGGRIQRNDTLGPKYLGPTLTGQTMLWMGSKFGFGTFRVGDLRRAFVFELDRQSLNDRVELPHFKGDPIEAECAFSSQRCWFFTVHEERGRTIYRCSVIDHSGAVVASAEAQEGDQSWLAVGHGRCAVTLPGKDPKVVHALFLVTDDEELIRVDIDEATGSFVEKVRFPDTKGLVHHDDRLFMSNDGLVLVGTNEVRRMRMS